MTLFRIQRTVRSRVVASPSRVARPRVVLARVARSTSRPAFRVARPSRPARVARRRALADARAHLLARFPSPFFGGPFPRRFNRSSFTLRRVSSGAVNSGSSAAMDFG